VLNREDLVNGKNGEGEEGITQPEQDMLSLRHNKKAARMWLQFAPSMTVNSRGLVEIRADSEPGVIVEKP
jgi:hypothetical protein